MKLLESGRLWPYGVGIAITMVFGFCVATVVVTSKANLQESDAYMTSYQDADINANKLIEAKLAFDKKYDVAYTTATISEKNPVIEYKVTDKTGKGVDDAVIVVAISRPETQKYNQKLTQPHIKDGVYSFEGATFPKAGVWNIIAKIQVGDDYRFLNIKADTRNTKVREFD
jgi:nitrogen fixation protein FixH